MFTFIKLNWEKLSFHFRPFSVFVFLSDIRDLDKWSPRMREPFENMYGRDYFKKHWNLWIDSISSYRTKGDGMWKSPGTLVLFLVCLLYIVVHNCQYFRCNFRNWLAQLMDINLPLISVSLILLLTGDICRIEVDKVACPTLIIHGQQDALVPQSHAEYLNQHIKNSRFVLDLQRNLCTWLMVALHRAYAGVELGTGPI